MNEKFNKNAKVEKLTKKVGRGVRLIVIGPFSTDWQTRLNLYIPTIPLAREIDFDLINRPML